MFFSKEEKGALQAYTLKVCSLIVLLLTLSAQKFC